MVLPGDPRDLRYLRTGTEAQQAAYQELIDLDIWSTLAAYTPVLAGTVPLDLNLPGSDLDVICHADDLSAFREVLDRRYGGHAGYRSGIVAKDDGPAVVASFAASPFPVEVFGQGLPVERQRAYRHLVVEARVLQLGGAAALESLRGLRGQGLKTEPAFARLLGLSGDPYLALLDLERLDDGQLGRLVQQRLAAVNDRSDGV